MAVNLVKTVAHKSQSISALEMLKTMGDPMVPFFAEEVNNGGDPNDIRIYRVVARKYPEMLRYVRRQTSLICNISRQFVDELAERKQQYEDGLISTVEYARAIEYAAVCVQKDMEGLIEY